MFYLDNDKPFRQGFEEVEAKKIFNDLKQGLHKKYGVIPSKKKARQGEFNFNWILEGHNNRKYVLSIPRKNLEIVQSIDREYTGIGFLNFGGRFRFRTIIEIVDFTRQCEESGFVVPKILEFSPNYIVRNFIHGETLAETLRQADDLLGIAVRYLTEILRAHQSNIIFGDRWGPNEIVLPDKKICFFDFDIKLLDLGKEFELAQTIYYSILYSSRKNTTTDALSYLLLNNRKGLIYDWDKIISLLNGHCKFFTEDPQYGGVEQYVKKITEKITS